MPVTLSIVFDYVQGNNGDGMTSDITTNPMQSRFSYINRYCTLNINIANI